MTLPPSCPWCAAPTTPCQRCTGDVPGHDWLLIAAVVLMCVALGITLVIATGSYR